MADYDADKQRLTLKLVYYGPAQSGKTTNLMRLHDLLSPQYKGEIMVLDTQDDRTLFFDLLPLGFRTDSGLLVKFKIFTVPGQVAHDSTRKAILSRADGVVFVADSQINQRANNAESFGNLEQNAARVGIDFGHLPIAIQFNKRDLDSIVTEAEVRERWAAAPWPLFFASALEGQGVLETLAGLLEPLYQRLDALFDLQVEHHLSLEQFLQGALAALRPGELP